jgi:hypothetical protein
VSETVCNSLTAEVHGSVKTAPGCLEPALFFNRADFCLAAGYTLTPACLVHEPEPGFLKRPAAFLPAFQPGSCKLQLLDVCAGQNSTVCLALLQFCRCLGDQSFEAEEKV